MGTIAAAITLLVALGGATRASAGVIDIKTYFPNPAVASSHDLAIDTVTCWSGFPTHFKWVSNLRGSDGSVFSMQDSQGSVDLYVWADNYMYSVAGMWPTATGMVFSTGAPFTRSYRRFLDLDSLPMTEEWFTFTGVVRVPDGPPGPVTPIGESARSMRIETTSDHAPAQDCNPSVAHGRTTFHDATTGELLVAEDFWISDYVPECGRPEVYHKGLRRFQHHEYGWASREACVNAQGGIWHGNGHCQTIDVLLCWAAK